MTGKGSMRRPFDRNKFEGNYDKVFGRTSKQGRSRDLARLQSKIFMLIKENKANTKLLLAECAEVSIAEVGYCLQALKRKRSIAYDGDNWFVMQRDNNA